MKSDPEQSRVRIHKKKSYLRFKYQVCGCTYSQMKLKELNYFVTRHFYSGIGASTYEINQEQLKPQ